MKTIKKKRRVSVCGILITLAVMLVCHSTAYALEEDEAVRILIQNESLFESNTIGGNILRYIGWGVTKGLAAVGKAAAGLYDTCFGFVDFTTFPEVCDFIEKWKPVFIALVCLSLLFIGILLCVGWEKKPKIAINLLIAVTVVTSSTWVIGQMNSLISSGVRNEILEGEGGTSIVYNVVGTNIHDLVYLDQSFGLENLNRKKKAEKVYKKFTEEQFQNISINETVEPDEVSEEAEKIMANGIQSEFSNGGGIKYSLDELYDGVAWTDLLNEYYYRYTVDWGAMWMELLSLAIIYLFMSYKVIRCLFEIVVHQLLAYLYSANLNNNQKILKILDSLKDSYILLLMTTVMIKCYLLACRYITSWEISGLSKGFILLFLAFAVIDGPNLVQKLTGSDMGASDGMGKMMSLFYGSQMAGGAVRAAGGAVRFGAGAVKGGIQNGKELYQKVKNHLGREDGAGEAMEGMAAGMAGDSPGGTDSAGSGGSGGREGRMNPGQKDTGGDRTGAVPDAAGAMAAGSMADGTAESSGPGVDPSGQGENDPSGQAGENKGFSSTPDNKKMSPGQGQNRMDQIGKGMQSKQDALNGRQAGGGKEDPIQRKMGTMERDVSGMSGSGGMGLDMYSSPSGQPLGTGGHILKEPDVSSLSDNPAGNRMPDLGQTGKGKRRNLALEENGGGKK